LPHITAPLHNWWTKSRQHWQIWQTALIVLAGSVCYSNTFQVQFIMDDNPVIDYHGPMQIWEILLHGGPRRLTDATFALNYHLHGTAVAGYHLVNLVIHLAAAATLFFIIVSALQTLLSSSEDTGEETGSIERFLPLTVAMLFAVHPLQTQAVTYIVQRYTSMATLLYLLAVLFFIKGRQAWENNETHRPLFLGAASLAAGTLAAASKQIAFSLPLMLICLELFLFRGRLLNRRFMIACGAGAIMATALLLAVWHDRSLDEILRGLDQATSEDPTTTRLTYALTQTRVLVTYLRLLCLPLEQNLFHEVQSHTSLFELSVMASLALHIALIVTAVLLNRASARRSVSGDHLGSALQRLTALGIVWFYVAMLVESSIFPITDLMFEHRIYLPSAGFFLATASTAALAAKDSRVRITALRWLLTGCCLVLGGMTFARNQLWGDPLAFRLDTVRKTPSKDLALVNLAGEYMKRNMPEKALPLFVRALELSPFYMTTTKVHLGMTLQRFDIDRSRYTTGEEIISSKEFNGRVTLERSEELKLQVIMYNNLGLAREYLGEPAMAKEHYRSAISINPDYDLAWYNLGLLAAAQGDKGLAVYALAQLKRLNSTREQALARILIPQASPPLKQ